MMNRLIFVFLMPLFIIAAGCNTTAGILSGAGKDFQAAGSWISPKEQVPLK
jgi:predicted small secreted protein